MVEAWTCDEVIAWLTEKKLVFWAKEFKACREEGLEIDGLTLEQIDEESLYEDFPNSRALCRKQLVAKIRHIGKEANARSRTASPPQSPNREPTSTPPQEPVSDASPTKTTNLSLTPPPRSPNRSPTPPPRSPNRTPTSPPRSTKSTPSSPRRSPDRAPPPFQAPNNTPAPMFAAPNPPKDNNTQRLPWEKSPASKPMTSPAIHADSSAASPGQKKRPSMFRWESMLDMTPKVEGSALPPPPITVPPPPPPPISMRQLQNGPSMQNIYKRMSISELKRIEPSSVEAFTEEFQQKAMEIGLLTVDEDSVSAPPAPSSAGEWSPPTKSKAKAKAKAGPAPAEKIRQLQNQMSFRVPMLSPRTAVHFAALPPEYNEDLLNKMSTERTGEELDSAQTILGLHAVIKEEAHYRFDSQKGLNPVPEPKGEDMVKVMKKEFEQVRVPHVKIEGTWIADMLDDDANLLGGSHKFEIDNVPVNLPVVDADEEIMAFFGCKLIRKGDVVTFPELRRPFPVFCLQIGQKYMENYILERELGGGVFLEYHDDNPHFHAPLSRRSSGYLLLGVPSEDRRGKPPLPKRPDQTQKVTLKVAGVRVPYGCAVYTPPGVLHADSACTGRWLIGYDQSTDFSTVLFRNKDDEVVKMSEMRITM